MLKYTKIHYTGLDITTERLLRVYYWQHRYSRKAESSSSRLETHLSSKIFLITSIVHIFSSSIAWYFMDSQSEITKSDIYYFPDSLNIHLKFLPVTDLVSCSIAERSMFKTGFVDFLINWIIHKNLLINLFLMCSFPFPLLGNLW